MGTKKKYFLFAGIIITILLFASGAVILVKKKHDSVAFSIDGQNYSKTYYNSLISQAGKHSIAPATAKMQVIAIAKEQHIATKLGITINDTQIFAGARLRFAIAQNATLSEYEKLVGWDTAYADKLKFIRLGGSEGFIFFYPFDQLFIKPPFNELAPPVGFGDKTKIAALKNYAMTQATDDRDQLIAKKITDAQLINKLSKDTQLVYTNSANDSYQFRDVNPGPEVKGQLYGSTLPSYVLEQITTLNKKEGVTQIATQSTNFIDSMLSPGFTNPVDEAYYFVHVTTFQKPDNTIDAKTESLLKNLKVSINV